MNGVERTLKGSTMGASLGRVAAAAAVLVMAGCTLSVDANRKQCSVDGDCADRGFAETVCIDSLCRTAPPPPPPPEWSCINNPPPQSAPTGSTFKVKTRATNIANSALGVKQAQVRVCGGTDPGCSAPLFAPVIADDQGNVEFTVGANFAGYAEFSAEGYMSTLYFFSPPVRQDLNITSVQMAPPGVAGALTSLLQVELIPGRGLMLINVFNCNGLAAQGITFRSPTAVSDTVTFYADGSFPVKDLVETQASGYGGFVNMPVSSAQLYAHLAATGQQLLKSVALVRADTLTIARMIHDG
jgi:hypothetical protein